MNLSHDVWKKILLICGMGLVIALVLGGERTPGYAQDIPPAARAEIAELVDQVQDETVTYLNGIRATMSEIEALKIAAENETNPRWKRFLWAAYWTRLERLADVGTRLQVSVLNQELPYIVRIRFIGRSLTFDPDWRFRREFRSIARRYDIGLSLVEEEFHNQSNAKYFEMEQQITGLLTDIRGMVSALAGRDNLPPILEINNPEEGKCYSGIDITFHDPAPRYDMVFISWRYGWCWEGEERQSGIDLESLRATLGGVDVTDELAIFPAPLGWYNFKISARGWPLPPEGSSVTLEVSIKDFAGNETTASVTFRVDRTAPVIDVTAEGAIEVDGRKYLPTNTPTIIANYSDAISGVNTGTFSAVSDMVGDLTSLAHVESNQATVQITQEKALPEGANKITASIRDVCGNEGEGAIDFIVDSTPPQVNILEPQEGWVLESLTGSYKLEFSDETSGVNELSINGTPIILSEEEKEPGRTIIKEGEIILQVGINTLTVTATDKAGHSTTMQTTFMVELPAQAGLEILPDPEKTKKYQDGLIGRSTELPLLVRAYNADNPNEPLPGVSLSFQLIEGSGVFVVAEGYSTVTDENGIAGMRFLYGKKAGTNIVRVSKFAGEDDSPAVEFILTGEAPTIQVNDDYPDVNGIPSLGDQIPGSALSKLLKVQAEWSGGPLAGERVKYDIVKPEEVTVNGDTYTIYRPVDNPENIGTFLPSVSLTDSEGELQAAFVINEYALGDDLEKAIYLRVFLPGFLDIETGEPISQVFTGIIRTSDNPNYPMILERIDSGNAQIGASGETLSSPLVAKCDGYGTPDDIWMEFYIEEGSGYLEFASGRRNYVIETNADGKATAMAVELDTDYKSGVSLTFGSENETHLVRAHAVAPVVWTVYFAAGPPEARFAEETYLNSGQYKELGNIRAGLFIDPSTAEIVTLQGNSFSVEVKHPVGGPNTIMHNLKTLDFNGNPVAALEGAIAPVAQTIVLSKIAETECYGIYRSEPVLATKERNQEITPLTIAPTGEKVIQLFGKGVRYEGQYVSSEIEYDHFKLAGMQDPAEDFFLHHPDFEEHYNTKYVNDDVIPNALDIRLVIVQPEHDAYVFHILTGDNIGSVINEHGCGAQFCIFIDADADGVSDYIALTTNYAEAVLLTPDFIVVDELQVSINGNSICIKVPLARLSNDFGWMLCSRFALPPGEPFKTATDGIRVSPIVDIADPGIGSSMILKDIHFSEPYEEKEEVIKLSDILNRLANRDGNPGDQLDANGNRIQVQDWRLVPKANKPRIDLKKGWYYEVWAIAHNAANAGGSFLAGLIYNDKNNNGNFDDGEEGGWVWVCPFVDGQHEGRFYWDSKQKNKLLWFHHSLWDKDGNDNDKDGRGDRVTFRWFHPELVPKDIPKGKKPYDEEKLENVLGKLRINNYEKWGGAICSKTIDYYEPFNNPHPFSKGICEDKTFANGTSVRYVRFRKKDIFRITQDKLPDGEPAKQYEHAIKIATKKETGDPFNWTKVNATAWPGWLELDQKKGILKGTPPATPNSAQFTLKVRVKYKIPVIPNTEVSDEKEFVLRVHNLKITTSEDDPGLSTGEIGKFYYFEIKASGGKKPYTWDVLEGEEQPWGEDKPYYKLPEGLKAMPDPQNNQLVIAGDIVNKETERGQHHVIVQLTDADGNMVEKTFVFKVK